MCCVCYVRYTPSLLIIRTYQNASLEHESGHNIAFHASPTARKQALLISAFPAQRVALFNPLQTRAANQALV